MHPWYVYARVRVCVCVFLCIYEFCFLVYLDWITPDHIYHGYSSLPYTIFGLNLSYYSRFVDFYRKNEMFLWKLKWEEHKDRNEQNNKKKESICKSKKIGCLMRFFRHLFFISFNAMETCLRQWNTQIDTQYLQWFFSFVVALFFS